MYTSCDVIRKSIYEDQFEVLEDLSSFDAIADYGLMSGAIDFPKLDGGDTAVSFKVIRNPYLDMSVSVMADWEFRRDMDMPIAMSFTAPYEGSFYGNIYDKSFASFDMDELKEHFYNSLTFNNNYSKLDTITVKEYFLSTDYANYKMYAERTRDSTSITAFTYLLENESHMYAFTYDIEGAIDTSTMGLILGSIVHCAYRDGGRILLSD